MADCKFIERCIFFNDQMANMPEAADLLKRRYCQGTSDQCARFMIASRLGPAAVPRDLFPPRVEVARAILDGAGVVD